MLRLLAQGLTNQEIGAVLGISANTVKHHVANLLDKLELRNRAAAARWAALNDLESGYSTAPGHQIPPHPNSR